MPQQIKLNPDKIIVLVGLMGCGKSSIGKRLAKALNLQFIDLDNRIEDITGMSITEIFAAHGEAYFRQLELIEIKKILAGKNIVLATGGGAFINEEIRRLIKEISLSIWIKADLNTLLTRVSGRKTRPILENGNKAEILKDLMDKRYPIYAQADVTVNTGNGTHEVVLRKIIEAINARI